jgi:chemotaxis protein methyltransferase CheR
MCHLAWKLIEIGPVSYQSAFSAAFKVRCAKDWGPMFSSELRDIDFEKIGRLVYDHCGINLHDGKKELVKARLSKRLREGDFKTFGDYYRYVTTAEGTDELVTMIDSLSTNVTFFFREENHFVKLRQILPDMLKRPARNGRPGRLLIWSAGCSTGEEPYSLAITVCQCAEDKPVDVAITATDISTRVLHAAANGVYQQDKLKNVSPGLLKKYFQSGSGRWEGHCRMKKEIRDMVRFKRFNLMETPPPDFLFDVIFCRNVMIYFDKTTQAALVNRFYNCLNKGGHFFVGHSESLTGLDHGFKYIQPSVYRK